MGQKWDQAVGEGTLGIGATQARRHWLGRTCWTIEEFMTWARDCATPTRSSFQVRGPTSSKPGLLPFLSSLMSLLRCSATRTCYRCSLSVILIGGYGARTEIRVVDPTTSLSHEIRNSSAYPRSIEGAAGVSMGDGSVLVCGGGGFYNPKTAECNYVKSTTLALVNAPSLPEAAYHHQVLQYLHPYRGSPACFAFP